MHFSCSSDGKPRSNYLTRFLAFNWCTKCQLPALRWAMIVRQTKMVFLQGLKSEETKFWKGNLSVSILQSFFMLLKKPLTSHRVLNSWAASFWQTFKKIVNVVASRSKAPWCTARGLGVALSFQQVSGGQGQLQVEYGVGWGWDAKPLILHARGWGGQRCGQRNNEVELVLPN